MPDKPSTWAPALAWLSQHAALLYAPLLSLATSALRIIYGGGTRRQAVLEALLCMLLTAAAFPLLSYFGLPENLAASLGGGIGFVGVKKISDWADRFGDIKLPSRNAD
ncbi:hypothetical protein PS870_01710 [Pseudomonas fluorescens]|jgi:phage holin, lambda family|uniref:Phage holin, lambda family n=1 Tax=Pseudomonas fluorescens TaxID=294 RepID=A0A5E7ITZ6_PSEFL|nr:phage holin, lambda family [Pseudomonas fluorescens]VVO79386.1 hypothetical protein PS870_01710 [Pseudomonas fluorescens]